MTSVNEVNAYNRGKREGYDIGVANTIERAKKEGLELRWMKLLIAGAIGFALAVAIEAHAETAQTSVTVVIPVQVTAEVACNPTNCPEIAEEEPVQIQNVAQEESLLQRIWSAILRALT